MVDERAFHRGLAVVLFVAGVGAFVRLMIGKQAPYGRYNTTNKDKDTDKGSREKARSSHGYGPDMSARLAWFLMESPNLWASAICLFVPGLADPACLHSKANRLLLGLFTLHYTQRALLYPLLMPRTSRPMPVGVMGLAWLFCMSNGYLQARYLTRFHAYPDEWLGSPMLAAGTALFAIGFALNVHADSVLRGLAWRRLAQKAKKGQGGYAIPKGGLFELVSAANYAAEMLEWGGFALASGLSYPGVTFAAFTFLNLAPRAIAHHRWYHHHFADRYPKGRKALIPFVY